MSVFFAKTFIFAEDVATPVITWTVSLFSKNC